VGHKPIRPFLSTPSPAQAVALRIRALAGAIASAMYLLAIFGAAWPVLTRRDSARALRVSLMIITSDDHERSALKRVLDRSNWLCLCARTSRKGLTRSPRPRAALW
jgi:hypothetical protein